MLLLELESAGSCRTETAGEPYVGDHYIGPMVAHIYQSGFQGCPGYATSPGA